MVGFEPTMSMCRCSRKNNVDHRHPNNNNTNNDNDKSRMTINRQRNKVILILIMTGIVVIANLFVVTNHNIHMIDTFKSLGDSVRTTSTTTSTTTSYATMMPTKEARNDTSAISKATTTKTNNTTTTTTVATTRIGETNASEGGVEYPNHQPNHHHPNQQQNVSYVPPLPWEQSCSNKPSSKIPNSCCVGSTSFGNEVTYGSRLSNCSQLSNDTYYEAEQISKSFLGNTRIQLPTTKKSSMECDVCHIIHYLFLHNMSLTFVGDSIMCQTFNAFECELHRRGYTNWIETKTVGVRQQPPELHWKYGIRYDINLTLMRDSSSTSSFSAAKTITTTTTTTNKRNNNQTIRIRFHRAYRPNVESDEVRPK